MKKMVANTPTLTLLMLVTLAGAAALGAEKSAKAGASGPSAAIIAETDSIYQAQDKKLLEACKLADEGKFQEAINLLEEVIKEQELEIGNVESWRGKSRYREFAAKKESFKERFAEDKLGKARQAYANGEFGRCDALAREIIDLGYCNDDAEELILAARNRQESLEKSAKIDVYNQEQALKKNEKDIKQALLSARKLMKVHRYEEARHKVEEVFLIDPFNAEAAYLASQIYEAYYTHGYHRRLADAKSMLAYEGWQWVEPVFPRIQSVNANTESIVKSANDYSEQEKLDTIIFPTVKFEEADMNAIISFLQGNRRFDPDKKGINIDYVGSAIDKNDDSMLPDSGAAGDRQGKRPSGGVEARVNGPDMEQPGMEDPTKQQQEETPTGTAEQKLVTLELRRVSLRELLDYICYLTDMSYEVRDGRVYIGNFIGNMVSRRHEITASVCQMVKGGGAVDGGAPIDAPPAMDAPGGVGGEGGNQGILATAGSGPAQKYDISTAELQAFFTKYGVEFPKGSKISYSNKTAKITMYNTEHNQRVLGAVLQELNVEKPLVQIEVKSIEITEEKYEELGFNWSFNEIGSGDATTSSQWSLAQGQNTTYNQSSSEASANAMLRNTLGKALGGVDSGLLKNFQIFPDLLGSFKPFGSDKEFNLALTINALDRSDYTEVISSPKVLVASGEEASVQMGKSYYFPESWDDLEVELESTGSGTSVNTLYTITAPVPTFGESQLMGTNFTVRPTVQDDNRTIHLSIHPRITNYVKPEEYSVKVTIYRPNGKKGWEKSDNESKDYYVWRPVIATHALDVEVNVYHGETLVLGGLADSINKSRLDKIPLLADLPFIGRLFQSHSENVVRKNMLIFVTAKLVDNSGVPIRRLENEGGIPDVNN